MSKGKKALIIIVSILLVIAIVISIIAVISKVASDGLMTAVQKVEAVVYDEPTIKPVLDETTGKAKMDEDGNFNFIDKEGILDKRNFRVLQLTDIHLGAGAFSMNNDAWTIRTVEDIIRRQKPDLVVVTGDVVYPVGFQAGTTNNVKESTIFANLMEKLEVYWCVVFGNHDTESYSKANRQEIGNLYMSDEYKHCIINANKRHLNDGSEVFGVGNYAVNLRNKDGDLVHTMFMIDSNAYLPDDPVGILWHYDRIHDDQLKWYEETSKKLQLVEKDIKSTLYFHIAPTDMINLVEEWGETGDTNTLVKRDGFLGEYVMGSKENKEIYDILAANNSTGIFIGHDHLNNASYLYDKDGFNNGKLGIKFTYGMSIDYLAYPGIYKKTSQRGGRMIEINSVDSLNMCENIADYEYKVEDFEEDKEFGFYTYHIPYWKNLAKEK